MCSVGSNTSAWFESTTVGSCFGNRTPSVVPVLDYDALAVVDDAARERANESHQMLTDLVAAKIRKAGAIPKRNRFVDLSALLRDDLYLFEMKSTTGGNVHSQIRRAVSQLYEYRYLQQVPTAKLVVVIENPPPPTRDG